MFNMVNFNKFKTFIFDLDGTLWDYPNPMPGAPELISKLREKGKQILVVTNFTILSRKGISKKLKEIDIEIEDDEIINPSVVIAENLFEENPRVMVFGEGVKKDLKEVGFKIVEELPVDYLIVSHDMEFDYKKLVLGFEALKNGAKFIVTSIDPSYPMEGKIYPGTGAIASSLEYATEIKPTLFGKPSEYMRLIMEMNVLSPRKETVFIGDRIDTDVKFAKGSGYKTCLVKTGMYEWVKDSKVKPDYVISSLKEIKI